MSLLQRIAERASKNPEAARKIAPKGRPAALMLCLTLALPAAAQDRSPVETVDRVELDRYAGDWFEIARFPNRFQRRCVGDVRASYAVRPDGRLDVVNQCRTEEGLIEARGVARVVDSRTFAKLKVRFAPAFLSFLPFVWGDYWVLGLADDYGWATVGSPDREYLWILARRLTLASDDYAAALEAARSNGFDVDRLMRTTHAGQVGSGAR